MRDSTRFRVGDGTAAFLTAREAAIRIAGYRLFRASRGYEAGTFSLNPADRRVDAVSTYARVFNHSR